MGDVENGMRDLDVAAQSLRAAAKSLRAGDRSAHGDRAAWLAEGVRLLEADLTVEVMPSPEEFVEMGTRIMGEDR